jgi:hypothetical protein
MKQRRRIYYSETQKALMWERWRKGDTLHQIARLFDRYHSSVQRILAESGGIQPAPRHRSRLALTLAEREEISRSVVAGLSIRSIAFRLGRAPSAPPSLRHRYSFSWCQPFVFSLRIRSKVLTFRTKACIEFMPPLHRLPSGP